MNDESMNKPAFADQSAEQLSALMDGELASDQIRFLLRGIDAQSDLAQRWSNYQVISASLKREYIAVALPANFAAGVMDRLDAEAAKADSATSIATRRAGLGALRWVGGGAIAAAVAVVSLVVSRPIGNHNDFAVSANSGAALVQQMPTRQAYLPLLSPGAVNTSPLSGADIFRANDVSPVSYEVLPQVFSPNGDRLMSRNAPARASMPYIINIVPVQQHPLAPQAPSQTPAPAQR